MILNFVEKDKVQTLHAADHYVYIPSLDLLQCQLICKKWTSIAQSIFYRDIYIRQPANIEKLSTTLIDSQNNLKSMVEMVHIHNNDKSTEDQQLATFFKEITSLCPNIKVIYTCQEPPYIFYASLMKQRKEGQLLKLEIMPVLEDYNHYSQMSLQKHFQYFKTALALKETLRNLVTCDWMMEKTFDNLANMKNFKNLQDWTFLIINPKRFFSMHKLIKHNLQVQSIHVKYCQYPSMVTDILTLSNMEPLTNIRQFRGENWPLANDLVLNYLMDAFPNIENIKLSMEQLEPQMLTFGSKSVNVSTSTAIRFLKYLCNMSTFDASALYVENVGDVLTGFYDNLGTLIVSYSWCRPERDSRASLRLCNNGASAKGDKNRVIVVVNWLADKSNLPHMGLVERAGQSLISLNLNMDENLSKRRSRDKGAGSNGSYVDNIFQHCPNLRQLSLLKTFLITYNTDVPIKQGLQGGQIKLVQSFIGPDYLAHLSLRCPRLDLLWLSNTSFVYRNGSPMKQPSSITIAMASTRFREIRWCMDERNTSSLATTFYLKVEKMASSEVLCLQGSTANLSESSEEEYKKSLPNDSSLSIHLMCQAVENFCIITPGIRITIKFDGNTPSIFENQVVIDHTI